MECINSSLVLVVLGLAGFFSNASTNAAEAPLTLSRTIALAGYRGDFDHFAYDPSRKRFLLAAEDHGTVDVFDLKTGAHLQSLSGFGNPHNIVIRPGTSTMLVVDSGPSKSAILDTATYRKIRNVPLEIGANATLYDPQRGRIYITTGGDRVNSNVSKLIAVNPDTGVILKSAALPSIHLQPLAMDAATNRLFVNVADKNKVAIVDRDSLKLLTQWPIGTVTGNSAIAFDSAKHRLYVMGKSGGLAVLNSDTGRLTEKIPVPVDADDIAFDETTHRLYVPGGKGFLGVYDVADPDHVKEVARIVTRDDARTGLLIPSEHKYLLAASETDGKPAAVLIYDVH